MIFNANTFLPFFPCLFSHPSVSIFPSHQKSNTENVINVTSPNTFAHGSCKQNQRDESILWVSVSSAATLKSPHGLLHGLTIQRTALEEKSVQNLPLWPVLLVLLEIPLPPLLGIIFTGNQIIIFSYRFLGTAHICGALSRTIWKCSSHHIPVQSVLEISCLKNQPDSKTLNCRSKNTVEAWSLFGTTGLCLGKAEGLPL